MIYLRKLLLILKQKISDILRLYTTKFYLTKKISFTVKNETLYALEHFTFRSKEMVKEMQAFLELSKQKRCFLDVGALYGVFSLAFTSINPKSQAYAIEPSTKPYCFLKKNVKLNSKLKIKTFQLALGRTNNKEIKMKYEWQHLVAVGKKDKTKQYITLKTQTLDNFLIKNNILPDIIKIDVEGYEYDVLIGAKKFLKKAKPIIFLELHIHLLQNHNIAPKKIINLIHSLNYQLYDLKKNIIKNPEEYLIKNKNCRVILQ